MNPALLALGVAVTLAAVLAVSARDPRFATLGLLGALAGAPLIVDPLSAPLGIGARIAAATLATYLVRVSVRRTPVGRGSRVGWPAEAAIAGAAFVAGLGAVGAAGSVVPVPASSVALDAAAGPAPAVAAGFALVVLSLAPLADARDVIRLGTGALLLLSAAGLLQSGLAGTPSGIDDLAMSAALVGLGGAVAILEVRTGVAARAPVAGVMAAPEDAPKRSGGAPASEPTSTPGRTETPGSTETAAPAGRRRWRLRR